MNLETQARLAIGFVVGCMVLLVVVAVVLATQWANRAAECEQRGGVLVRGGVCIRTDNVIPLGAPA